MTELIICGQAPSRVGDGTPFTGPSGRRLAKLFGLRDFGTLAAQVTLTNIFDVPAARKPLPARRRLHRAPGDTFDAQLARVRADAKMLRWSQQEHQIVVLGCGAKVFTALTTFTKPMYVGVAFQGVHVWHFPHPSGASQYWNDPANVAQAERFLKRLLDRYGIAIAR